LSFKTLCRPLARGHTRRMGGDYLRSSCLKTRGSPAADRTISRLTDRPGSPSHCRPAMIPNCPSIPQLSRHSRQPSRHSRQPFLLRLRCGVQPFVPAHKSPRQPMPLLSLDQRARRQPMSPELVSPGWCPMRPWLRSRRPWLRSRRPWWRPMRPWWRPMRPWLRSRRPWLRSRRPWLRWYCSSLCESRGCVDRMCESRGCVDRLCGPVVWTGCVWIACGLRKNVLADCLF